MSATPVQKSITTPDGKSCKFYVQCYEDLGTGGFAIWGIDDTAEKNIYIFDKYSLERKAGTKLVNGAATSYEAYTNSATAGNITLVQELDASKSDKDINFGPDKADGLGGTKF